jgi:protein-L-isoaspartate(D-aspartate) O-methyltransferase
MQPTGLDTYKHQGLRLKLVEEIKKKGIKDEGVLHAINSIPRHLFLDSAFQHIAYEDRAFPIGEGQTISQPYTVAYQTQLLQVKPNMKVLEIGTGSAYQASVLAFLKCQVFTIERQKKLFDKNKKFDFITSQKNIKLFYGDGFEGLPTYAPFDRIIITAAAPEIPAKLIDQLKPNGLLIIPKNNGTQQTMLRITKIDKENITTESFEEFDFVPMLKGKV